MAKAKPKKKQGPDVAIRDEGSIVLITPRTDAGTDWIASHLPDDCQRFGFSYVVEHRFAEDIITGMQSDGLTVAPDTNQTWGF